MATKRIAIDPVTRIEGHARVTIHLDDNNAVERAQMHVVEFRGFERFVRGRPYWEMPVLVQRLCGICPVSHHLAAAKAMDQVVGAAALTPTAEKMRRLMHYGQILQSHALHFFHLAAPDLLFGFDADPAQRNVVHLARTDREAARQGVLLRAFGQEIIRATAGKRIHGTGAIPGGMNKNLSIEERDRFLKEIDQIMEWSRGALALARDYSLGHLEQLEPFAAFPSTHLSIVGPSGELDLYDGRLRAIDAGGERILDGVAVEDYLDHFAEEVRPWSYMKFPYLKERGPEAGWYRVGPLARINTCDLILTPQAEEARRELLSALGGERARSMSMAYHWARMIELLHAAEMIQRLLHDPDLQGEDLVVRGERAPRGMAVLEAPRGTLIHRYDVDENGQVALAHVMVATTHNNEPMNRAVAAVARDHIAGRSEITEGLLNHVEVAIRAYDPCLSCATHALGQMELAVELVGPDGALLARDIR
jgi:NAD-reducing hydrogenase large subunit